MMLKSTHSACAVSSRTYRVDCSRSHPPLGDVYTCAIHSGFKYTASYTVPTAPSTKSAVLLGPSYKLCSVGYVSARDF